MFRRSISKVVVVLLVLALLAAIVPAAMAKTGGKVSKFGVYSGYSEALYDNWTRSSMYVEVRDGTKLAVDIFRPVYDNDQVVEEPLPVVFSAERYVRATSPAPGVMNTTLDAYPYAATLLQHGYVVAAADVRGTGASYGVFSGGTDMTEAYDFYDMIEWFAAQPWCDGNVGMLGISWFAAEPDEGGATGRLTSKPSSRTTRSGSPSGTCTPGELIRQCCCTCKFSVATEEAPLTTEEGSSGRRRHNPDNRMYSTSSTSWRERVARRNAVFKHLMRTRRPLRPGGLEEIKRR